MAAQQGAPGDVVEYRLFPDIPSSITTENVPKYLEEQIDIYLAHLSHLLVEYIWQNEPFCLRFVPASGSIPPHLYGATNFGDNIEDEWFIVQLLRDLTSAYTGLVAKVDDSDGEFLLIEAADVLPKWLNPDTAENRVYIYDGEVNVIPTPDSPALITPLPAGTPGIKDAINCIREFPTATQAADNIQKAIRRRIGSYPEKMQESFHRANCYVPAAVAAVLQHSPALIAPAVQAFYHRDPADLQACRIMTYFRPGTRVTTQVKFTRCLYAQLMQQGFQPDKRSGWNIPSSSSPNFKAYDLGMKLAHGLEILCSQCGSKPAESTDEESPAGQIPTGSRWQRFVEALSDKGYFRYELEGSKLYQQLLEDAKHYFCNMVLTQNSKGQNDTGYQVLKILQTAEYDIEEMRKQEKKLPQSDDDSWLEISPEQLEQMLSKTAGSAGQSKASSKQDAFDLTEMSDGMKSFVDKVSSHEGAEFPKQDDDESGEIQFDAGGFVHSMQKIFDFKDEDSASSSDMSEYGSDGEDYDELGSAAKMSGRQPGSIDDYMELMDRELAKTNIGKSFERQTGASGSKPSVAKKPGVTKKPPVAKKPAAATACDDDLFDGMDDVDDLDDHFDPVNVDMTLVKNILDSYSAQEGQAGPASNILNSMGIQVPDDQDK